MRQYRATAEGGWPIHFGADARELLLELVGDAPPDKLFIITDRTVEGLHLETIRENLPHAVDVEVIVFNEGEENKNLATLEHVAGDLIRLGAGAGSLVLNVGGGVVMNLGGLAASLIGHGLRFAQVPTTFAAQWQTANTRRQAVHFIGHQNLIGVWRTPEFTVVDPFFVSTEPEEQVRASMADLAAAALIHGGKLFDDLSAALAKPGFHQHPECLPALEAGFAFALASAAGDPMEHGGQLLAEYGQPLGRALESLSDGRLRPGEARAIGMRVAAELAKARGLMSDAEHARHESLIRSLGLPGLPDYVRTDRIIFKLHGNNKTIFDNLKIPILAGIGSPVEAPPLFTDAETAAAVERVRKS